MLVEVDGANGVAALACRGHQLVAEGGDKLDHSYQAAVQFNARPPQHDQFPDPEA